MRQLFGNNFILLRFFVTVFVTVKRNTRKVEKEKSLESLTNQGFEE
jgi:hypothetical protein